MPSIQLYEYAPTRSKKCRWILQEAGLAAESLGNRADLIGSEELRRVHPMGKLPAALIDGRPLFESSAIVTAIADLVPEKALIASPGSWERSLHDQWTCFSHSELECWAWSTLLNTMDFLTPKEQQIPAVVEQNRRFFARACKVIDDHLASADYMIGGQFSATDIIVGFAANVGRQLGYTQGFDAVHAWLERLYQRPHCTLNPPA